ncbi:hypothetical protein HNY73_005465 [Argiope bruennichi]|uniref:Uncharacterized protein n=1 Tax=Argiope bruennichi TaxID=94029 RepID=A0A8T0FHJ2_ARGBR|nr:hypothetical protein HNY73_005465 [Argiope bruennichi]
MANPCLFKLRANILHMRFQQCCCIEELGENDVRAHNRAWVANKNLSSYEQNLEKNSKVKGEKIWAAINAAQGYDTKISKIRISYDGRESMKLSYLCEFSDYYEKKRKLGKLVMPIEEEKKRKKRRRYNTRQSVRLSVCSQCSIRLASQQSKVNLVRLQRVFLRQTRYSVYAYR